jgi:hypothetical protein
VICPSYYTVKGKEETLRNRDHWERRGRRKRNKKSTLTIIIIHYKISLTIRYSNIQFKLDMCTDMYQRQCKSTKRRNYVAASTMLRNENASRNHMIFSLRLEKLAASRHSSCIVWFMVHVFSRVHPCALSNLREIVLRGAQSIDCNGRA